MVNVCAVRNAENVMQNYIAIRQVNLNHGISSSVATLKVVIKGL